MARVRLSAPAQEDLESILARSLERWGARGRSGYAALLTASIRTVAADPSGPMTHERDELLPGIRSFHVRHARGKHGVRQPVHVIYYRAPRTGVIEIVRVLHERMDPFRHLDEGTGRPRRRTPK
jgi:toxin ParE1/3/4